MTSGNQPSARVSVVASLLSQPRLVPYLTETGGNLADAFKLYQWNIELSGAAYESMHVFEVVLRNAMDQQLRRWNATQTDKQSGRRHSNDWLLDPAHLIRRLVAKDIKRARERAETACKTGKPGGRAPGHDDILAQTMFGTWRFLLPSHSDAGRTYLWHNALHAAFPRWPKQKGVDLTDHVEKVYRMRNRVAHLEPLLRQGYVSLRLQSMRLVLAGIDQHPEAWFTGQQRITTVLNGKP